MVYAYVCVRACVRVHVCMACQFGINFVFGSKQNILMFFEFDHSFICHTQLLGSGRFLKWNMEHGNVATEVLFLKLIFSYFYSLCCIFYCGRTQTCISPAISIIVQIPYIVRKTYLNEPEAFIGLISKYFARRNLANNLRI